MQVFPVLALVLYLIIAACKKEKSSGSAGRPGTVVNSTVSLRTIFLTVLLLPQSLFLFVFFSELIHPLFSFIKIPWLGTLFQYAFSTSITFSLIYYAFPWLAWRICRPIGLSWLSRLLYWFTPLANRKDLDNFAALLRASRGISPEPPPPEKNNIGVKIRKLLALYRRPPFVVDSSAVVMYALAREVQGDNVRAERLLRTFDLCQPGLATLGRVRRGLCRMQLLQVQPPKSLDLAVVGVAVLIKTDPLLSKCPMPSIAVGAVAPTAVRAKKAEAILIGSNLKGPAIEETAKAASGVCEDRDTSMRASAWCYKKR